MYFTSYHMSIRSMGMGWRHYTPVWQNPDILPRCFRSAIFQDGALLASVARPKALEDVLKRDPCPDWEEFVLYCPSSVYPLLRQFQHEAHDINSSFRGWDRLLAGHYLGAVYVTRCSRWCVGGEC